MVQKTAIAIAIAIAIGSGMTGLAEAWIWASDPRSRCLNASRAKA